MWSLLVAGCAHEYDVARVSRVDLFVQDRLDAVDVLVVIDNSRSMIEEQDHLARSFDELIGALSTGNTDWRLAVTTTETSYPEHRGVLAGGTDEVVLRLGGEELDRFEWSDRGTVEASDGESLVRCSNGTLEAGPPGPRAEHPCGPTADEGPDDGPRPPAPGDLVVTEVLARTEARCQWIELANLTSDTLDASGVELADDGRDAALMPEGTRIGPGARVLVGRSADGCGVAPEVVVEEGLHLARGERWVDASTPDAADVYGELVAVGTGGFGIEMGLDNARRVLEEPADPDHDLGFQRAGADLALLFLTDEDDLSPLPVADYVNLFRALKSVSGHRVDGRVRIAVAAGIDAPAAPGEPSCASPLGEAAYASRLDALAEATGGLAWSICGDLSSMATDVGLTFSDQLTSFRLSGVPAVTTLEVLEYTDATSHDLVGALTRGVDYALERRDGEVWMTFPEGRVPPGALVLVRYELLPDSAELFPETP